MAQSGSEKGKTELWRELYSCVHGFPMGTAGISSFLSIYLLIDIDSTFWFIYVRTYVFDGNRPQFVFFHDQNRQSIDSRSTVDRLSISRVDFAVPQIV